MFAPTLVKHQTIIKGGGVDGKDIGWWDMPKEIAGATDGPVMNTALCALQLQVYYRYLPTYKSKAVEAEEPAPEAAAEPDGVKIDISIPGRG